jgi:hypothetical protein
MVRIQRVEPDMVARPFARENGRCGYDAQMFGRRRVVQNETVAHLMEGFFTYSPYRPRSGASGDSFEYVARRYGEFLWRDEVNGLVAENRLSRSRFYVGLSVDGSAQSFAELTKRVALISDTLLLSHDWTGHFHELGISENIRAGSAPEVAIPPALDAMEAALDGYVTRDLQRSVDRALERDLERRQLQSDAYGMHVPDLENLGRWIIDAEPLLRAGMAWYLPSYSTTVLEMIGGQKRVPVDRPTDRVKAMDYLIRDGRAVDASGAEPIKSQLVRPVLQAELPFLAGVGLRDFSKITVGEFASYSAFRDFLRLSLLELDQSLNATEADRELVKLGLRINDQIRAVRADMERAKKRRAVAASGAAVGSVAAILTAVYGPALQTAIAALGVGGGAWGIINAMTDNNIRALREDKWYYVWVLARKGRRC